MTAATRIYFVALGSGSGAAGLQSGATFATRYGILFGPSSSLLGMQIKTWKVNLRKGGLPSGNITAAIYDSGNNLISTANEIVDSTTLPPTTFANYTWTFATARTITANDRLVIQYNNPGRIEIEVYITDQFDGINTLRTRYVDGAWVEDTSTDVAGEIVMDTIVVTSTSIRKYNIAMTTCSTLMHRYAIEDFTGENRPSNVAPKITPYLYNHWSINNPAKEEIS